MKQIASEILLEQLQYIKDKDPEDRMKWELSLTLDCFKACSEDDYKTALVDMSNVPDEDIEARIDKRKKGKRK